MSRGGARNRSGPQANPQSLRSGQRKIVLTALPNEGYTGEAPTWPLHGQSGREVELWTWAWTTPQACAWILDRWRWHSVAMWVRVAVICEGPMAQAADKSGLHRFADQIGMTPAGLKENGWAIAAVEVGAPAEPEPEKKPPTSARDRMKVVSGGGGG